MPKIITQIAKIATSHLGGRQQLTSSPAAKVTATIPLLFLRLRIVLPPSLP